MVRKLSLLLLFTLTLCVCTKGQFYIADVQFNKIEEATVENYLHKQISKEIVTFSDVKPSLEPSSSTDGFLFHEREYVVKDSLHKVWHHYIHTNPGDAWNAGKMNFGMMFSKKKNELVYPNDEVEQIEEGQLVYLNLNLLKIKNIATAFEIITVDNKDGIIEFSYVEDNMTRGKQQLNFMETPTGKTKIIHRSFFRSKSKLRDHFLYPYFHTRMTNAYHRNMKKLYKKQTLN